MVEVIGVSLEDGLTDAGNLTVYEPDNNTLVYGVRCGMGW